MSHSTRSAFLALLVLLVPAASALAVGQGRLQGEVVDENGKPVAGVTIRATNDEIGYDNTFDTNKAGKFQMLVVDATRAYTLTLTKDGHATVTEPTKLEPGGITRKTFTLPSKDAAPSAASSAPASGSNRAVNAFNEGVRALQAGDRAAAKEHFLQAVELDPEMPQPHSVLAGIYLDEKDYAEAIEASRRVLEIQPDDLRALQTLYDAYSATGDEAKAGEILAKLSSIEGGGTDAAVRVFNLGAEAVRVGDVEGAIAHFRKAVELDPGLAPGHLALARLHLARSEYDEALAAADEALAAAGAEEKAGLIVDVHKVRYEAYRDTGQDAKAQEVFAELSAADPKGLGETLFEQGRDAFEANQMEPAKQALGQVLQVDPDHPRAHYFLGLVYVNLGDTAKAKEHLARFVELAPDDPEVASANDMLGYLD